MDLSHIFSEEGILSANIPGFRARPQQQSMAESIGEAIEQQRTFVAEAGTGTGKTFAYLAPVLLSGRRALISTATKTLQDQLFKRDLPAICQALNTPVHCALLKGRDNYVCLYRLERAEQYNLFPSDQSLLETIRAWAAITTTGDKAEVAEISDQAPIWQTVTSTKDNCLGSECPNFADCFVAAARRNAQCADIVVINHHLFLADLVLKDEGVGELLPNVDVRIFDEAHQLPDVASVFFSQTLSTHQCMALLTDVSAFIQTSPTDTQAFMRTFRLIEDAIRHLRRLLPPGVGRFSKAQIDNQYGAFSEALNPLCQALTQLADMLQHIDDGSAESTQLAARAIAMRNLAAAWLDIEEINDNSANTDSAESIDTASPLSEHINDTTASVFPNQSGNAVFESNTDAQKTRAANANTSNHGNTLSDTEHTDTAVSNPLAHEKSPSVTKYTDTAVSIISNQDISDSDTKQTVTKPESETNPSIEWLELTKRHVKLHKTPLNVGQIMQTHREKSSGAWIFLSATLAVERSFSHFVQEFGLNDANTGYWESPFQYDRQTLLLIPKGLPEPNSVVHTRTIVETTLPLVHYAPGGAFFLFTSLSAVQTAERIVSAWLKEHTLEDDILLLVQGMQSRTELLAQFRAASKAILLGSHSFWEGIDMPGDILSLVMIDKIPFQPPDDPVLNAKSHRLAREGKSSFMTLQLPKAVISLKQGAGRLIRSETDRGVLVLGDPRLLTKAYGRKILKSLPFTVISREIDDAVNLFLSFQENSLDADEPSHSHDNAAPDKSEMELKTIQNEQIANPTEPTRLAEGIAAD